MNLKEDMKKIALTIFTLLITSGFVFAGGMGCSGYKQEIFADRTDHEILVTSNDLQLIKFNDNMGNTRFSVKNLDGTFQAENLSRLRLRIEFPDLENQIDPESIAKS